MTGWLFRALRGARRQRTARSRAATPALPKWRFEPLEDRRMLAIQTVYALAAGSTAGGSPDANLTPVGSAIVGTTFTRRRWHGAPACGFARHRSVHFPHLNAGRPDKLFQPAGHHAGWTEVYRRTGWRGQCPERETARHQLDDLQRRDVRHRPDWRPQCRAGARTDHQLAGRVVPVAGIAGHRRRGQPAQPDVHDQLRQRTFAGLQTKPQRLVHTAGFQRRIGGPGDALSQYGQRRPGQSQFQRLRIYRGSRRVQCCQYHAAQQWSRRSPGDGPGQCGGRAHEPRGQRRDRRGESIVDARRRRHRLQRLPRHNLQWRSQHAAQHHTAGGHGHEFPRHGRRAGQYVLLLRPGDRRLAGQRPPTSSRPRRCRPPRTPRPRSIWARRSTCRASRPMARSLPAAWTAWGTP